MPHRIRRVNTQTSRDPGQALRPTRQQTDDAQAFCIRHGFHEFQCIILHRLPVSKSNSITIELDFMDFEHTVKGGKGPDAVPGRGSKSEAVNSVIIRSYTSPVTFSEAPSGSLEARVL